MSEGDTTTGRKIKWKEAKPAGRNSSAIQRVRPFTEHEGRYA